MSTNRTHSSRRAFFLNGGAVLGAGVAAGASALAAGKSPPLNDSAQDDQLKQLRAELDAAADREAVRQLHLAFTAMVEVQDYDAAARLFADHAHLDDYRQQSAPSLHAAYRPNSLQQRDVVTLSDDRQSAVATFHVDARICTPLQGEFTVARMARLQGQVADSRWETGRLEVQYVQRSPRVWRIASLRYVAT
jgi:hypothetical protein